VIDADLKIVIESIIFPFNFWRQKSCGACVGGYQIEAVQEVGRSSSITRSVISSYLLLRRQIILTTTLGCHSSRSNSSHPVKGIKALDRVECKRHDIYRKILLISIPSKQIMEHVTEFAWYLHPSDMGDPGVREFPDPEIACISGVDRLVYDLDEQASGLRCGGLLQQGLVGA
jgi:hypothetical protein